MVEARGSSSDGTPPNFRTTMELAVLLRGFTKTVASIYEPAKFYERAWRSLQNWETRKSQHPAKQPTTGGILSILARSIWHQGLRSSYRKAYWGFFLRMFVRYTMNRPKIWLGFIILISGHHFIPYASEVVQKVEQELLRIETAAEQVATHAGG